MFPFENRRLAPSDVCASMYMEHLLRALHVTDGHLSEAMGECIDTQFVGVLEHMHEHVMGRSTTEDDYDAEVNLATCYLPRAACRVLLAACCLLLATCCFPHGQPGTLLT